MTERAQQIVNAGHRVSDGEISLGSLIRQGKEPMTARVNYEYAAVIREVADLAELQHSYDVLMEIANEIEAL